MNINVQVSPGQLAETSSKYSTNHKVKETKENQKLATSLDGLDTKDIKTRDIKRNPVKVDVSVSTEDSNTDSTKELTQGGMSGFLDKLSSMFESFISTLTKLVDKLVDLTSKPAINNKPAETSPELVSDANSTKESFNDRTTKYFNETSKGTVSELKMQEAVVMYQLYQKDEGAESIFKTKLAEAKSQGKTGQSAIKAALIETEKSGKIARWESDWVFSLSYRAAQLDDNIKDLKTQNTGSNMPQKLAIDTAERTLLAIATGVEIPVNRPVASAAE